MAGEVTKIYGRLTRSLFAGEVNLNSHAVKIALCSSAYVPDQDVHQYFAHVASEATGPGYTAGGQTVTNLTWSYDPASNTITVDFDDPSWPNSTITAKWAVIYVDNGTPNKPLMAYGDLGGNISSTNSTFTTKVNAAGLLTFTVA
ncbi:hypothetical protein [Nocardia brasiliensis]|uniref:hypothetical protein n=1 Tax=Nocardia brasiliensis TaxID=37326 RepID=UPI0036705716